MQLLEQHFNAAFAAPDGIEKLRELILALAMQGKLVEQDPSDQSASELLQEIDQEKRCLVAAGKIKAPKPLPVVEVYEVPHEVPTGWAWVRLGDVINSVIGGGTPSKNNAGFWGGEIPWASVKDMNVDIYLDDTIEKITQAGLEVSTSNLVDAGSVILCTRVGLGKIAINNVPVAINQDLKAIYLSEKIDKMYFFFKYKNYKIQGSGMTVAGIRKDELLNFPFPLPPLPEQRRIVARIDELMTCCAELEALCTKREQKRVDAHTAALNTLLSAQEPAALAEAWQFMNQHFNNLYSIPKNVAELRKAVLQMAVMGKLAEQDPNDASVESTIGDLNLPLSTSEAYTYQEGIRSEINYPIPSGWTLFRLKDIVSKGPTYGYSPKAVAHMTSVKSLALNATTSGIFKPEFYKYIDESIPYESDLWLEDGDILVQRGNTIDYVGVPAIFKGPPKEYIYPDLMMRLRLKLGVNIEFVHHHMSSNNSREYLRARASGTMPKINQSALRSLPIALPPVAEQRRIVAKLDHLMALCDQLEVGLAAQADRQSALLASVIAAVTPASAAPTHRAACAKQ